MSVRLEPSVRASTLVPRICLVSLSLALVLCWATTAAAQERSWDDIIADFSAQIAADVENDGVGGITAGIVVGRDLLWGRGFGFADRERHIPATVSTIYRVGSVSKSFTAVAMMQAAEGGLFALDDPVEGVLPALSGLADRPAGAIPVTFRHLASHTSGLIREPQLERAAYGPLNEWEDKILASIPTTSFFERPGVQYQYSNIGYGILGLATSRAAGVPFMDLVMEGIVETLGMTSTFFALTPDTWPRMAKGYANRRFGPVDPDNPPSDEDLVNTEDPYREHSGRGYKVPNGGVYSTIADLGLFIAGMTGAAPRAILSPEGRAEMMRVQTPESGDRLYGLGFFIYDTEDGTRLVGHSGSVSGYSVYMLLEPKSAIGVIVLRNYNRGGTNLGEAASSLLLDLLEAHR